MHYALSLIYNFIYSLHLRCFPFPSVICTHYFLSLLDGDLAIPSHPHYTTPHTTLFYPLYLNLEIKSTKNLQLILVI